MTVTRQAGKPLRLGVVGMSDGNGHPFSWSAICNGYRPQLMEACGFPAIPRYLEQHRFPEECISGATVTCAWTQDPSLSSQLAETCRIERVVASLDEMAAEVDAVLLARDDAENHLRMSRPFLEAGLPVFVDKPLALTRRDAEEILALQRYAGQVFSCSALRHAPELLELKSNDGSAGGVVHVQGVVPKSWDRYAVHAIDPMFALLGPQGAIEASSVAVAAGSHVVCVRWASSLQASFTALPATATRVLLRVFRSQGCEEIVFRDTFGAFRNALQAFIDSVNGVLAPEPAESLLDVIDVVEHGRKHAKH